MPDCDSVSVPTVRAYLKRLPSGAYRVTVLAPSLLRPLFRMYPADTGEAEAVSRAVGRALELRDQHAEDKRHEYDEPSPKPVFACPNEVAENERHKNDRSDLHLLSTVPRSEQQPADGQDNADQCETAPVERVAHGSNEVTQHRRPPRRVCVVWQGLL